LKSFVPIHALIISSMASVHLIAPPAQCEFAAPWPIASEQMGLAKEREMGLSPDLSLEFNAAQIDLKLWVFFTDKNIFDETAYHTAVDLLAVSYNPRSIERRRLRRTAPGLFDGHDLPLSPAYLKTITDLDIRIETKSRWLNSVSVHADRAQAERIASLACVQAVRLVRSSKRDDRRPFRKVGINGLLAISCG